MSTPSLRGKILRNLLSHMDPGHFIGRRNVQEKSWKCPENMNLEKIAMPNFNMELLSFKELSRTDYIILQLHGGGYIGDMNNSHRTTAKWYLEASKGMPVLTINYRIAPDFPFPAALDDAFSAFSWLQNRGFRSSQIIVVGDSAGGGLALALGMYLKNQNQSLPGGYVLMSPETDLTASGDSYKENYDKDPLLGKGRGPNFKQNPYIGNANPKNPFLSPLFGDFTNFPPMLIQVGSYEMLLSDSTDVAKKAKKANVQVRLSIYEGMFHVFQKARPFLPEAMKAWREIGGFFRLFK